MGLFDKLFKKKKTDPNAEMAKIEEAWKATDKELDRQIAKGMDEMPADQGQIYIENAQRAAMTNYNYLRARAEQQMDQILSDRLRSLSGKKGYIEGGNELLDQQILDKLIKGNSR